MTTRDQARRGAARLRADRGRNPIIAEPAPSLHERLFAARERKGVDLYRAERDTKIRARYLAALERGDYKDLPGAVYTKGFLRNYALYLGLDPEDVLYQWRRERVDVKEPPPLIAMPRPMAAPRRGLSFSPAIVVAVLMTIGVALFSVYIGSQLLRFTKPPSLALTDPVVAVLDVDESTTAYTLRGTSVAGASVLITTPGRERPYLVTAAADGTWSAQVDLRRGRNQFEINATDAETGKQAETPLKVFITVPFQAVVPAPTLTLIHPDDGTTVENGAISVDGKTANASKVAISVAWVGPAPVPGLPAASPSPQPAASPGASPGAVPGGQTPPPPVEAPVQEDGSFSLPLELGTGTWAITVTAMGELGRTASLTRTVTVAWTGLALTVTAQGGSAWIKVWVDDVIDPSVGPSGRTLRNGQSVTLTGLRSIEVRTGSSGVTQFTLNGVSLGAFGKAGVPETWLFAPPEPPTKTQRR